jgi:hypothetical protein
MTAEAGEVRRAIRASAAMGVPCSPIPKATEAIFSRRAQREPLAA